VCYFVDSSEPNYTHCQNDGDFSCTISNPFNVSGKRAEDTVVFIKVNGSDHCGATQSVEKRLQLFQIGMVLCYSHCMLLVHIDFNL
jgi:hypothetical protein